MKKIVDISSVADDKWDRGSDRIETLTKEEHNAEAVQEEVNKKLGETSAIKVGGSVKIVGVMYCTGEYIPGLVKESRHKVSQIDGNKVLLGEDGGINSWVYLKDISK